jgi:hypothetical protein
LFVGKFNKGKRKGEKEKRKTCPPVKLSEVSEAQALGQRGKNTKNILVSKNKK